MEKHHRVSMVSTQHSRKPILVGKKKPIKVIIVYNELGENVTPKPLNPDIFLSRDRQSSVHEIVDYGMSESSTTQLSKSSQSAVRFKQEMEKQGIGHSTVQYRGSMQALVCDAYLDAFLPEEERFDDTEVLPATVGTVKPIFKERKIPTSVSLILNETSTFFLLDITSTTEIKETDEGILVEQDNELYDFLTIGKGKHRKVVQTEAQTMAMVLKTRNTSYEKVKTQPGSAFASVYDMYDTLLETKEEHEEEDVEEDEEEVEEGNVKLEESGSVDSIKLSADEKCMSKLIKNPKFLDACIVMERLLANNCFNEQQKVFMGLSEPDPFRENIQYKYRLNLLWTFANNDTIGKSVNCCDWNPANKGILAVGYGKFYFHDNVTGLILIWNIKNPVQPERKYSFQQPVTTLQFSKGTPALLAVGFYNGSVKILNICSRETMIIGENVPTFEPCWDISWQYGRNERRNEELVMVTFDDGKIGAYSIQRKLQMSQLMRVGKADGKLKGYEAMKKCTSLSIPVSRYASAFFVCFHPFDPSLYFVGTNEGTIHKCSLNYLSQHLDVFLAHEGSVHEMKFSPFFKQIFATCGDDWHTRIWAEGIPEPILTIGGMQSVEGLDWSPTHSTMVVVIRSSNIEIWDVQRKVYEAQSITASPTGSRNTVVQFTESGRCLIVGDTDGNVHFFSLEDMPFVPFFQENLLSDSLARVLITNPQVLASLKKLRRAAKQSKLT
ncbi:unnamed protein product [Phyllotreta striolata]|uniref:Dynein axonemal intermediate chain 4 n=1 Tax=Phyllotreta striolata TaxID=444603 RepID=A0A9N9XJG1_PHYSR|nr:unnamed protein product [Phyllotreta striolata]